jgi:integrase
VFAGELPPRKISAGTLSDFIASLERNTAEYSPRYIKNHRANLLTILRFAADRLNIPEIPARHVRRVKVPPPDPWAWSDDELARLVQAASSIGGNLPFRRRCTRSLYSLALIGAAYDTGLRRGNLFSLKHEQIAFDGIIRVRHHKTGQPHTCQLSPHVANLVRSIPYERPLNWTASSAEYSSLWRELCAIAGIRYGLTQQVRRTAATCVWEDEPAVVQRFLGHLTSDMWRFYVDVKRSEKPIAPRSIKQFGRGNA